MLRTDVAAEKMSAKHTACHSSDYQGKNIAILLRCCTAQYCTAAAFVRFCCDYFEQIFLAFVRLGHAGANIVLLKEFFASFLIFFFFNVFYSIFSKLSFHTFSPHRLLCHCSSVSLAQHGHAAGHRNHFACKLRVNYIKR